MAMEPKNSLSSRKIRAVVVSVIFASVCLCLAGLGYVGNWYVTGTQKIFFLYPHFNKNLVVEWTARGQTVEWRRNGQKLEKVSSRNGFWVNVNGIEIAVSPAKGEDIWYRFTGVDAAPFVAEDPWGQKQVYVVGQGWEPLKDSSFGLIPVSGELCDVTAFGVECTNRVTRWKLKPKQVREFRFSQKSRSVAMVSDFRVAIYRLDGSLKSLSKFESGIQDVAASRDTGKFAVLSSSWELVNEGSKPRDCIGGENNLSSLEMCGVIFPDTTSAAYLGSYHRSYLCSY